MIYLALVTFEHDGDDGRHLSPGWQGACGWMAVEAEDETEAVDNLAQSLAAVRLKLIEAERIHAVKGAAQARLIDEHLASNMKEWEPGRSAVWGTTHGYVGDRNS